MSSATDFIKQIRAQGKFFIADEFKVTGIEEVKEELEEFPEQLELFAVVKIKFEGELPDSYRILNAIIGDWVETHQAQLDKAVHPVLINYFQKEYPDSDLAHIKEGFEESPVWTDQADYMPRTKKGENTMEIEVELVFEPEIIEEDE